MIQKKFCQKAQVLTVQLEVLSVYLKDTKTGFPIYLLARWLPYLALSLMISISLLKPHILQAELADPQLWTFTIVLRIRGKVPGVNLEPSNLNSINVFNLYGEDSHKMM